MQRLANGQLPRSTAADAVKGKRLPSLRVVYAFVEVCHESARNNDIEVNDQDFSRRKWRKRWTEVKRQSRAVPDDAGDEASGRRAGRGDVEGERQWADAGSRSTTWLVHDVLFGQRAGQQIANAELLLVQGDVEGLRQRADAGDTWAAEALADLLFDQGDVEGLRQRADAGDVWGAEYLYYGP
jgi:hypothetical protein